MKAEKEVEILIPEGLHARPATDFVKLAKEFESRITIGLSDQVLDAKSVLSIMSLALKPGQKVWLAAEGPDAPEAIERLAGFLSA